MGHSLTLMEVIVGEGNFRVSKLYISSISCKCKCQMFIEYTPSFLPHYYTIVDTELVANLSGTALVD